MELTILILSAFITSSISAVIGMGGGIILLGIMATIIPEGYMVIALHGVIQLVSNTTRTYVFRKNINKKIVLEFFNGVLIGASISVVLIILFINFYKVESANEIKIEFLKPIIGMFIIWYLFLKKNRKRQALKSFVPVGAISGLSSIFIGATGPLIAPFFLNRNLHKEDIIANKAASQMITHLTKIPIFIYFFNVDYLNKIDILLPLTISVFLGTYFGRKILTFIPEKRFKIIFKVSLLIIANRLVLGY